MYESLTIGDDIADNIRRMWRDPLYLGVSMGYKGNAGRKVFGDFHQDLLLHSKSQAHTSTVVPRVHAKSTAISIIDTIHDMMTNPAGRNMIASATLGLSKKLVGEIRDRLTGNLEIAPGQFIPFREVFPWMEPAGVKARSGPTDTLNIVGRCGTGREPSLFAASVGMSLAGNHPTRAVIDDPVDEQNCRTHARRVQVIEFIEALIPLMYAVDSPVRHIGTPWAFADVSAHLANLDDWSQFRFSVWDGTNPDTGLADGQGPGPNGGWPLCPSYMTADEIYQVQENMSKQFFASQFLCSPIPAEDALFSPALLDAATNTFDTEADVPDGPELLLYDPVARVSGTDGDQNAIINVRVLTAGQLGLKGFLPERNIFIPVGAYELPGGADSAVQFIEEQTFERANLKSIWVEQVAAQSLFVPWMEERGRLNGVRVRGQKIGNAALPFRLMGLQTAMRQGLLIFPKSFPGSALLRRRLVEFPKSDSDDLPSALAMLSQTIERNGDVPGIDAPEQIPYNLNPMATFSAKPSWP